MNDTIREGEANYFAMCLLVPETLLRQRIAMISHFDMCNDKHIRSLAREFQVSEAVMGLRIGQIMEKL